MTDHPASWLADPTGRHDHRYWDGTRWTDHVADAGVAATDAYDGPADATPEVPPAAPTPASPSGWATTAEPAAPAATVEPEPEPSPSDGATFTMSGWGDTTADATDTEAEAEAPTSPWGTPTTSTWGSPAPTTTSSSPTWGAAPVGDTGTGEAEEALVDVGDDTTDVGDDATDVGDDATDVGDDATDVSDSPVARWGAGSTEVAPTTWGAPTTTTSTSTWGQPLPTEPVAEPAPAAEPPGGGSRKGLLVVVALAAIAALVVTLIVTGDDDGGGGADSIATQFAEQMQNRTSVSDDQAECVGDYVVDEIGESRIESIKDLEDRTAPPELQEDFDRAVQRAITECDVDQADLAPPVTSADGAADSAASDSAASREVFTEAQYTTYYQEALGLPEEDAACLAKHSAEAEASGAIQQGDSISQFYTWVDDCGIDPDELFQTIATADAESSTG